MEVLVWKFDRTPGIIMPACLATCWESQCTMEIGAGGTHIWENPFKFNIDTQKTPALKKDSFSKASFLGSMLSFAGVSFDRSLSINQGGCFLSKKFF